MTSYRLLTTVIFAHSELHLQTIHFPKVLNVRSSRFVRPLSKGGNHENNFERRFPEFYESPH